MPIDGQRMASVSPSWSIRATRAHAQRRCRSFSPVKAAQVPDSGPSASTPGVSQNMDRLAIAGALHEIGLLLELAGNPTSSTWSRAGSIYTTGSTWRGEGLLMARDVLNILPVDELRRAVRRQRVTWAARKPLATRRGRAAGSRPVARHPTRPRL